MKKALLSITATISAAVMTFAAAFAGESADAAKALTPSEAKAVAKAEDAKPIKVVKVYKVIGKLHNAGTNYFTDRRLVLKDEAGEIDVRPWLPLTVGRPISGNPADRREVISDYLGKDVVLTGMVVRQPVKGVSGLREVLVVKDADVAPK